VRATTRLSNCSSFDISATADADHRPRARSVRAPKQEHRRPRSSGVHRLRTSLPIALDASAFQQAMKQLGL